MMMLSMMAVLEVMMIMTLILLLKIVLMIILAMMTGQWVMLMTTPLRTMDVFVLMISAVQLV